MKNVLKVMFAIAAVLSCVVGCGNIVDGPGMVNTEYEQGY